MPVLVNGARRSRHPPSCARGSEGDPFGGPVDQFSGSGQSSFDPQELCWHALRPNEPHGGGVVKASRPGLDISAVAADRTDRAFSVRRIRPSRSKTSRKAHPPIEDHRRRLGWPPTAMCSTSYATRRQPRRLAPPGTARHRLESAIPREGLEPVDSCDRPTTHQRRLHRLRSGIDPLLRCRAFGPTARRW